MSNDNVPTTRDEDSGKGAVEQDRGGQATNVSRTGEIGHRDQDALLKSSDSDFPEPGQNEEHTCEPESRNQLNRDTEIACQDEKSSSRQNHNRERSETG